MLALIFTWKAPADDHRLELGVIDVGRDDGAAAGDLAADQLGREAFAEGDELHLGGDLSAAGVVELGDGAAPTQDGAPEAIGATSPCGGQLAPHARSRIQASRTRGRPSRTSQPCGPLAS